MGYIARNKQLNEIDFQTVTVKRGKYKGKLLCDNPMSFDIETSSGFMKNNKIIPFNKKYSPEYWEEYEKVGIMYIWQFAIDNNVFYGRTINDLLEFLDELEEVCPAYKFVYIHNQAFEFQAVLRESFSIESVFARDVRHPMSTTLTDYNIEFRCSYFLTNLSLDNCVKEYRLITQKLVGDLDYIKIRTPLTRLSKQELDYCFNDVLILTEMILKFREEYKHIYNIPLTQTGEVRRDLRKIMTNFPKWLKLCKALNNVSYNQYVEWCRMFTGGTVHANRLYANRILKSDIWCYDFGSDYPFQIITRKYPLSLFVETDYSEKYENVEKYSYIIHIEVTNLQSIKFNEYISKSKAITIKNCIDDNGKILSADYLEIKLTNIDYNIFRQCYSGDINIISFKYAINDYLPDELCKFVVELYKAKSTLKGQKGVEDLYMKKKQKLNSTFGMAVTKIICDQIMYDNNDWLTQQLTEALYMEKLEENNNKSLSSHILPFQIGLWIPAYARQMLWEHFVIPYDDLILYYDTDSIYTHSQEVLKGVKKHNEWSSKQRADTCNRLGIPLTDLEPKDVKGNVHKLGDMELDGEYTEGIFLGAKRYCLRSKEDGQLHQTVAGVRKGSVDVLKDDISNFKNGLVYNYDGSQKLIMTYIDNQEPGIVWNKGKYDEYISYNKHAVNAMPTTFTLELADNYLKLLQTTRKDEVLQNVPKILF